jgi:hypothetical protein
MTPHDTTQWIDPGEIRELVDRVRDGYESAPPWAQAILLAMIGVGVLVVIFRIVRSLVARLIGLVLAGVITAVLRFYGHDVIERERLDRVLPLTGRMPAAIDEGVRCKSEELIPGGRVGECQSTKWRGS